MQNKINRKKAERLASSKMIETGHCSHALLKNINELIGLDNLSELITASSGTSGGLGYQGAVCGVLTCGALILGGTNLITDDKENDVIERSRNVNNFVSQFKNLFGSTQCSILTQRDLNNQWHVRKHILFDTNRCIKICAQSAALIIDILNETDQSPDSCLNKIAGEFSNKKFNCANSVIRTIFNKTNIDNVLPEHMLMPLNGGIGFSGSTCSALTGGCLAIGLLSGKDTSPGGKLKTVTNTLKAFAQGTIANKNPNISPVAEANILCSELVEWFETEYKTTMCRHISGLHFCDGDINQRDTLQIQDSIQKCMRISENTAKKTKELVAHLLT